MGAGAGVWVSAGGGASGPGVTVAEPPEKLPASIVLTGLEDGQQIAMGDKIQLTATVLDEDGSTDISQDVIWDCSNWGIANVEDGLVAPFSMDS